MSWLVRLGLYLQGRSRSVLCAMLVVLHWALLAGDSGLGLTCWLVHVGLFMLWQPFVAPEKPLERGALFSLAVLLALGAWCYGWWLLIFWCALLASVTGGRMFFAGSRLTRWRHLCGFFYLVYMLLVWVVPHVLPVSVVGEVVLEYVLVAWLPLLLPVCILLLPLPEHEDDFRREGVDFLNSFFLFLLLSVVVLGTFAVMQLRQASYLVALFNALLGVGAMLLMVAWAWSPQVGLKGLSGLASKYFASVCLPIGTWLQCLVDYASDESDPDTFMQRALTFLVSLSGITGVRWHVQSGEHSAHDPMHLVGEVGSGIQSFKFDPVLFEVNAKERMSPAVILHFHLLLQIANAFYAAKLRARDLQQLSYLSAVHETGARLTHEVKNLLQSMHNLCYMVQTADIEKATTIYPLLKRQLPLLADRLQQTLDKFRQPVSFAGNDGVNDSLTTLAWWQGVVDRYALYAIDFEAPQMADEIFAQAPLFSLAVDHLIRNALAKKPVEEGFKIRVEFFATERVLRVTDSGEPIADTICARLFKSVIPSETGFGIGLYQLTRFAMQSRFAVYLVSNARGCVCFELREAAVQSL